MDARLFDLIRVAATALEEKKAFEIVVLDVSLRTSIADAFILCSVSSLRQAQAVADAVDQALLACGRRALSVEGYHGSGWLLMDYGDFVLHIFLEERREYFALEQLWGDAPDITAKLRAAAP
ncbi:MAG: ribosome silencing factor [Thermoanaerobaculaceae bacterium]|nr:ribosome silencing factor [Thermoanaerobaculaceae bacterium]